MIDKPKDTTELQVEEETKLPTERKDYVKEKSQQEIEEEKIQEIELMYEKQTLIEELNKNVEDFDHDIETLQHAKMKSESDKKYGEMKLIIGYDALCMLTGLIKRDKELTEQLGEFRKKKLEIAKEFNKIAKQMTEKEATMNKLKDEKNAIMEVFDGLIPQNHPERQSLYSFFERKVRIKSLVKEGEQKQ